MVNSSLSAKQNIFNNFQDFCSWSSMVTYEFVEDREGKNILKMKLAGE